MAEVTAGGLAGEPVDVRAVPGDQVRARPSVRRFAGAVAACTLVGLAVRLAYLGWTDVPSTPGFLVNFDPIYYHRQALAVADGTGFIAPYRSDVVPSADHPPLLVLVLALASKLGVSSWGAHRMITALLGVLVVPVTGLLGRRVAGPRAGVVAAALVAIVPLAWANDGLLMPEPLFALAVAGALLVAHGAWANPTLGRATGLGVLIGLATLARGEGLLLIAFTVLPVALLAPTPGGLARRARFAAAAGVAFVAVLAPWTAYNLSRFENPVVVSTSSDTAFAGANCDLTYRGPALGSWTDACFAGHSNQRLEESVFAARIRADALDHVRTHVADLPRVVAARVGRIWDLYRPADGITLNELQNRPRVVSWAGLASSAVLVPAAVAGGLVLRRRGRPVVLLAAMPVMATVVAAAFYGNGRFRVAADLAIVVLAAVAVERLLPGRGDDDPPADDRAADHPAAGDAAAGRVPAGR